MKISKVREKFTAFLKEYKYVIIPCSISFIILMIYCIEKNNTEFYGDSGYYWSLSESFYSDGKFSFTQFYPQSIRGYFYPFILFVVRKIGGAIFRSQYIGLWILSSMSFSIILTILINFFVKKNAISIKRLIISSVVFSLFIVYFYKGMLIYPLSDHISIMLLIASIFFAIEKFKNNTLNIIKYPLVGMLLYGCYNTRPSYLISIIIFILVFILFNIKEKWKLVCNIIFIILGIIFVAWPQMVINNIYLETYSPLIIFSLGGAKSLNLLQLYLGLKCNSYKTMIAPLYDYPEIPGLTSINKTGAAIIQVENITPETISYLGIIKIILKYPFEMIGIYFTHLINILFVFDEEGYVKDMTRNLSLNFFISYVILYLNSLFLSVYDVKENSARNINNNMLSRLKAIDKKYIYFLCPSISTVLIILGQIESRYFIYIHIIMYFIIAFVIDYSKIWGLLKKHFIKITLSFFIFMCICSSIVSYNLASYPQEVTFALNPYAINTRNQIKEQEKQNATPYIPKAEANNNGYCPPTFSFITKTGGEGKISFSVTFDKDITAANSLNIFVDGELKESINNIEKKTYDFRLNVDQNKICGVKVQSTYYFNDDSNRQASFILNNIDIK